MVKPPNMKEYALRYAEQDLAVFPVFEPRKDGLGCNCKLAERCRRSGKHPRIKTGVKAATRDENIIDRWWNQWPAANIGVNAGRSDKHGLVIIDIDPKNRGSLRALPLTEEDRETPTILTGGGGIHLIFAAPEGVGIKASNALIDAPGIDVRSGDSYSIFPPSRHISGRCYQWIRGRAWGEVPVRALCDDLMELMKVREPTLAPSPAPPPEQLLSTGGLHPYVAAALNQDLERLANAQEGGRNSTLNQVAFGLFQFTHAGLLPETEVEDLLTNAALVIGLEAEEISRTLASAKAGALRKPRRVWPKDWK